MSNPTIIRRTEADVRCYQCGVSIGTLRRSAIRPFGPMLFRRATDGAWSVVHPPIRLECAACTRPAVVGVFMTTTWIDHPQQAHDHAPRPA